MDYLSYIKKFTPMTVLPNDKTTVSKPLLEMYIPTRSIDAKRALPSKQEYDDTEYKVYWGQRIQNNIIRSGGIKDLYKQFVGSWEGRKMTNTSGDRGGLTNNGITLSTWKSVGKDKNNDGVVDAKDLALMTQADHDNILEERFWNAARADEIVNPYLAAYVVDWTWGTGPTAFKKMHQAFGLKPQSKMTNELLSHLNANPISSFNTLVKARINFYKDLVHSNPSQQKFLKGWLKRANAITLEGLTFNK